MISLIQTSQNRIEDLQRYVESLNSQVNIDFSQVQLVFVDQGDCKIAFKNLNPCIKFTYIKYKPSSLSHARNVGLKYAEGEYVSFPDDDCWYAKDTLCKVLAVLGKHDGVLIKATNEEGIPLAKFPEGNQKATLFYHCGACSICIFLHLDNNIRFDENIGVGSPYGLASGEETDYLIHFIRHHIDVVYDKDILIHHPLGKTTFFASDLDKAYKYARGHGYLMKKNHYPINLIMISLLRPLVGMVWYLCKFNFLQSRRSFSLLKGRLEGLFYEVKN